MTKIYNIAMASISKIVRTTNPARTTTKLNMVSSTFNTSCVPAGGSRSCSTGSQPGSPTMYDLRKTHHELSQNTISPSFETLKNIPTGIFRHTGGEILGLGAGKTYHYKNPEYFSFHHMSFYDLNIGLRQYRKPCPKTGRKPN